VSVDVQFIRTPHSSSTSGMSNVVAKAVTASGGKGFPEYRLKIYPKG